MSKKLNDFLNYTVMAASLIGTIIGFIDENWDGAVWAFACFAWVVNCHIAEHNYYNVLNENENLKKGE